MRKLLVAFDGSDNAVRALHHAIRQVQVGGQDSIHLITAQDEPILYGEIAVYVPAATMAELQHRHSAAIIEVGEKLLRESGVAFTTEVLIGPVAAAIARRADELGCDGIVMGTSGMTALGNLLMGSVATKVLHLAHVPVTLVK
ncbi:MAG TPA: universal stress protein [Thermoanaerobaculia bacterium]|nr:universal stress protein [Thermoanaerobaculia bacterium]